MTTHHPLATTRAEHHTVFALLVDAVAGVAMIAAALGEVDPGDDPAWRHLRDSSECAAVDLAAALRLMRQDLETAAENAAASPA